MDSGDQPVSGYHTVGVELKLTAKDYTFSGAFPGIVTAQERRFGTTPINSCGNGLPAVADWASLSIKPGQSVEMCVPFDIPDGDSPKTLQVVAFPIQSPDGIGQWSLVGRETKPGTGGFPQLQ